MEPTEEQLREWCLTAKWSSDIARWAYQAGADAELDACVEWLKPYARALADNLREARRPKSPSLKQQALRDLQGLYECACILGDGVQLAYPDTVKQALEALPDE